MEPYERVPIGRSGLAVTRFGLGTAALGNLYQEVADSAAKDTVRCAWERGLRFYDTAPAYGYGLAELRLGEVLQGYPRDEFVLSTKVGRLLREDAPPDRWQARGDALFKATPPVGQVHDYSYDGAMRSIEESLARLGLDRVDLVHIHDPDAHFEEALDGAYRALEGLRSEGVVRAIGVGMNQCELLTRFAREADFDCFLLAGRYTLLDQSGLGELLPLSAEKKIDVIIGGVYNSGLLADPRPLSKFDYVPVEQARLDQALALDRICRRHHVPMKMAALQFPLAHPAVVAVLVGSRSVEEFEENERMMRCRIPTELWAELHATGLLAQTAPVPAG